jgi:hypothetical protein
VKPFFQPLTFRQCVLITALAFGQSAVLGGVHLLGLPPWVERGLMTVCLTGGGGVLLRVLGYRPATKAE